MITQAKAGRPFKAILVIVMLIGGGFYFQVPAENLSKNDLETFLNLDGPEAFDILIHNPDLLKQRSAQVKVYRSQRSKDPTILAAALRLCFQVPRLEIIAPMVHKRCNGAFIGKNPQQKQLLLKLVLEYPHLKKDLRVVGLIAMSLHSKDESLQHLGKTLVEKYPKLKENPAIREAVAETDSGLPNYQLFKNTVDPIFIASGSDGRACVNCHSKRPILFLPTAGPNDEKESIIRQRYLSVLRVVDLETPLDSLILNKPTNPVAEKPEETSNSNHHSGGPRFQKGDGTYQAILAWIQSAQN